MESNLEHFIFGRRLLKITACSLLTLCVMPASYAAHSTATMEVTQQKTTTIQGNVVDDNGDPLIGATVMEKGTKNGSVTGIDGRFSLKMSLPGRIIVTYIGYNKTLIPQHYYKLNFLST